MKLSTKAATKLLAAANDAMLVVNSNGAIVLANPQAEQLFGYRPDELLGEPIEILIPESARAHHETQRKNYRGAPHVRPLVSGLPLAGRRKDGATFAAEISLTPIEHGDDLLIASTIRSVDADNASDAYFRQLLQAAPDAMIIVDEEGRIAIANDQAEKMFGYERSELLGKPVEMLLPAGVRARHSGHRKDFARDPRLRPMGIGMKLEARRADGSEFPVEISLSPVVSSGSRFVSSVIRDVTQRKRMEADLIAARQEAERAHKANTAFLAAASHDLRQPVQALSLLNGALRRTVSDEIAQEIIESQQNSLDAMTNLLNSLLDISRLDAGAVEPDIEDFPVRRLIDRLSAEFARQARHKDLHFAAEPNGTIIRSDANLLSEIIQNLVSNAIRYTQRGKVTLTLRQVGDRLSIDVCDTGVGIPSEQIDEIFREFHQLKNPNAKKEGFGLGLAIVRRLADLLGHEVIVDSEPGEGSCFSVLVPVVTTGAAAAERPTVGASRATPVGSGVILLIEDDTSVSAAWSMLLRAEGYEVLLADSAASTRAVVEDFDGSIDLVISDFHLADSSTGVEAVEALRQHCDRSVPAFVVSGDTSKVVDEARGLENSLLMRKPVNTDELLALARDAIVSGSVPTD